MPFIRASPEKELERLLFGSRAGAMVHGGGSKHSSLSRACLRPHLIDNVQKKGRHPSGTSAVDVDRWCRS